jgi:hypothetical protein
MAEMNEKEKAEHQKTLNWVYTEAAAAVVVMGVVYCAVNQLPLDTQTLQTPNDRLVFTLRWLFISSLPIVSAIFGVLDVRGSTKAIDPIHGGAENLVELPNKILRNTIEQFSLHAVGVLSLTTYLDEKSMFIIRGLVVLFFLGRIFFVIGYKSSPSNRGFGFAITFLPTLLTYGYVLYKFVTTYILGF